MANGITVDESSLNVLQPKQFQGETFDQKVAHQIQANYYKGAPPQWVNFYLAEKNGMPFVKRDGYEEMKHLIKKQRRTRKTVAKVTLLHQPGSGGSTLAMQVLWDLRKDLLGVTLRGTDTDPTVISKELIELGKAHKGKPVLLLLDNVDMFKDSLQKSLYNCLIEEVNKIDVNTNVPIVIILNCVRKDVILDEAGTNTVTLKSKLQNTERQGFEGHLCKINEFFGNEHTEFYGFNIIQKDFNSDYVQAVCDSIKLQEKQQHNRKGQLFAILALVNSYAPGSNFVLDQCEKFLQRGKASVQSPSLLKAQMKPYSNLLVTFTLFEPLTYVRVAHPMIARRCIELLASKGAKRSKVACLFLETFCVDSPHLMMTVKAMLTMREFIETSNANSTKTDWRKAKNKFSNLILHIQECEGKQMCIKVLKNATKIFDNSPTFPQALARCYYLMTSGAFPGEDNEQQCMSMTDYRNAEHWAKKAIERHRDNSFIMDTLGEVHKHHLYNYMKKDKYCLSKNCMFKNEEQSHLEFLRLGELAISAFQKEEDAAERESEEGKTANISRFFNTSGKLGHREVAKVLMWAQRSDQMSEEVSKRTIFFQKYSTYSQPGPSEVDPPYVDIPAITNLTQLKDFLKSTKADHGPEIYHLNLLEQHGDISNTAITEMRQAYEKVYRKYYRSRYLTPLYMKSTKGWQTLSELQLEPWEIENGGNNDGTADLRALVKFSGTVRRPNIVVNINETEINVQPHIKENLLKNGDVSFYVGFNISGPVAFNINYEPMQTTE